MKIGIVTDGKYGERAFENIKTRFDSEWIQLPDIPLNVILDEDFNFNLPDCDLYISYLRHPDMILSLAEKTKKPIILGITPGQGLLNQLLEINPKIISPKTMCSIENNTGIPEVDEYASYFGKPLYKISVDKDIIKNVDIVRSSPCGSSKSGAEFLVGKKLSVDILQQFALSVCHECRAPRFGLTCDKEISGIIHILSILDASNKNFLSIPDSADIIQFQDKIKEELKKRQK
jgi:hypothetical protein